MSSTARVDLSLDVPLPSSLTVRMLGQNGLPTDQILCPDPIPTVNNVVDSALPYAITIIVMPTLLTILSLSIYSYTISIPLSRRPPLGKTIPGRITNPLTRLYPVVAPGGQADISRGRSTRHTRGPMHLPHTPPRLYPVVILPRRLNMRRL